MVKNIVKFKRQINNRMGKIFVIDFINSVNIYNI